MSILVNSLSETGLRCEEVSYVGKGVTSFDTYSYMNRPTTTQLQDMSRTLTFSHPIKFLLGCYHRTDAPQQNFPLSILLTQTSLFSTDWPTEWDNSFELFLNYSCYETGFGWIFTTKTNSDRTQISFAAWNYNDSSTSSQSLKNSYASMLRLESTVNTYVFYGFY